MIRSQPPVVSPDPGQLSEALVACQDRLLTRIRWMMGAPARRNAESMDFVGEVAAKILEQRDRLHWNDERHFLALATRIARNLIVDRVRNDRIRRFESFASQLSVGDIADADGTTPSQDADGKEQIGRLFEALESLGEDYQRVIELREFERLSFKQVAEQLGRSENAVSLLHKRAVTRIGRWLRQREQDG